IKMYWGNSDAFDRSDKEAVFDTAAGFVHVWHLGEDGNIVEDGYNDATFNRGHGKGQAGMADNDTLAMVGKGQWFDGGGAAGTEYISLLTNPTPLDGAEALTVSFWCNPATLPFVQYPAIFARGTTANRVPWVYGHTSTIHMNVKTDALSNDIGLSTPDLTANTWQYITFTWSEKIAQAYLNADTGAADTSTGTIMGNTDGANFIGVFTAGYRWNGGIDELRASKAARSEDWIKLSYRNQQLWDKLLPLYFSEPSNPTNPCQQDSGTTEDNVWQARVSDPHFTWAGASDEHSGIKGYYVYWGTDAVGEPDSFTTQTSFDPDSVAHGSVNYLRIKTEDNEGFISRAATIYTFKYDSTLPSAPGVPQPPGRIVNSSIIGFTWTVAADVETGISSYWLQVGNTPGDSNVLNSDLGDILYKEITDCQPNTTYYARVKAKNGASEWGPWSDNSPSVTIGYGGWQYNRNVVINTTASGADIQSNLVGFPMLIRLDTSNFNFDETQDMGQDIRFAKSDGTQIPHEIERWDDPDNIAEIWVRIDTVYGNNRRQYVTMFWGNAEASTISDGKAVFDTTNGFVGVWHLREDGNSIADGYKDATYYQDHAKSNNQTADSDVAALIGNGQTFDGNNTYLDLGESTWLDSTSAFSVSFWCLTNEDKFTTARGIFARGANGQRTPFIYGVGGQSYITIDFETATKVSDGAVTTPLLTPGQWHAVSFTWDGKTVTAYMDGVKGFTDATDDSVLAVSNGYNWLGAIRNATPAVREWSGILDEVRSAKVSRSADWVKLSYVNQSPENNLHGYSAPLLSDTTGIDSTLQVAQRTDGSDSVDIYYRLMDIDDTSNTVRAFYRLGASADWVALENVAGDTGLIDASGFTINRHIAWHVAGQIGNDITGNAAQIMLVAYDEKNLVDTLMMDSANLVLDTRAPLAASYVPVKDTDSVNVDASLTVIFNENMVKGNGYVLIYVDSSGALFDSVNISSSQVVVSGDTVTIDPDASFNRMTKYYINIESGAFTDAFGKPFAGISDTSTWSFTTAQVIGPILHTLYPRDNAINVALNDSLILSFHDTVFIDSGYIRIMEKDNDTLLIKIDVTSDQVRVSDSTKIVVQIDTVLTSAVEYYVIVDQGAFKDIFNKPYSGISSPDFWNFKTIDLVPPVLIGTNPGHEATDVNYLTDLRMVFDEKVFVDSGAIHILRALDNMTFKSIDVLSDNVTGSGTDTIMVAPDSILSSETQYYIKVDSSAFVDSSGNYFAGITDTSTWVFTTRAKTIPIIDSITSLNAGWRSIGDTIVFTLHFSDTLFLTGGNLNIPLKTGASGRTIRIEPFDSLTSVILKYVVANGDFTNSFDVDNLLSLEPGAVIKDKYGTAMNLVVPDAAKLSKRTTIRLDGSAPGVTEFKPASNTAVVGPIVSYTLKEKLKTGKIEWKSGSLNGISLPGDSAYQMLELNPEQLTVGNHEVRLNEHKLVDGAEYIIVLSFSDSAGNIISVQHDLIKLILSVDAVEITPKDTILNIGEELQYAIKGYSTVDDNRIEHTLDVVDIEWNLQSIGSFEDGLLTAPGLGTYQVIASWNENIADTAVIRVYGGEVHFADQTSDTVAVSQNLALYIPDLQSKSELKNMVINVTSADTSIGYDELIPKGPAFIFSTKTGTAVGFDDTITVRLKVDSLSMSKNDFKRVQIYMKTPDYGNDWVWLEPERDGEWLIVRTPVLDIIAAAIDTVVPTIEWKVSGNAAKQGERLGVVYKASDNIANPKIFLRTRKGGEFGDSLTLLPYKKGGALAAYINPQLVTKNGLWYSVEIWDGPHLVSADTIDAEVEIAENIVASETLSQDKYHFISIPFSMHEKNVRNYFFRNLGSEGPENWRIYDYSVDFVELGIEDSLTPGKSYFLRSKETPITLKLDSGKALSIPISRPLSVPASSGWTFLSNPYNFNISVDSVRYPDGSEITHLWSYNGEWLAKTNISQLEPWRGYLVWNSPIKGYDSLYIHPGAWDSSASSKKGTSKTGREIGMSMVTENARDGRLIFGFDYKDAQVNKDTYDYLKPVFLQKSANISMQVSWDMGVPYLTDYRGQLGEGLSWKFIARNESRKGFTFEFSGLSTLADSTRAVLLDMTRGKYTYLNQSSIAIAKSSGKDETFGLLVGNEEYLTAEIHKFNLRYSIFALGLIKPNPFSVYTEIYYSLPGNKTGDAIHMPVALDIYNIKGELVRRLLKGKMFPGPYSISWDGRDSRGTRLPSGTYLCRLQAGRNNKASKKMLLLR
ncbi:MAG: DUF2341 domain-containing protein, partial [Fibrobacteria bacterium]|nr:DUF2341 domain-containing protein [Fibrobacteria bacterium]